MLGHVGKEKKCTLTLANTWIIKKKNHQINFDSYFFLLTAAIEEPKIIHTTALES